MPTKTSKKSPLQIPPQLLMPLIQAGVSGSASTINELKSLKDDPTYQNKKGLGKAVYAYGEGTKAFGKGFFKNVFGTDFGITTKADKRAKEDAKAVEEKARKEKERVNNLISNEKTLKQNQSIENAQLQQNAIGSNINLYDQNAEELSSSPFTALTKKLKGIKGLVPANMSAAQYKSSLKMQEISGVNTLSNY